MDNVKSKQNVKYILRHLLNFNITDPLATSVRNFSDYTQYFSGDGTSDQINYLERTPVTGGRFVVELDGTATTDFTLDTAAGTITWDGSTDPSDDTDNIKLQYQTVKPWIYDDDTNLNSSYFPRMTIREIDFTNKTSGLGSYQNYNSSAGDYFTARFRIIVRTKNRSGRRDFTYGGIHYKNMDLTDAISQTVEDYLQTNRFLTPWKFFDWEVVNSQRIYTEEDNGILRRDITLDVMYYEKLTGGS